MAAGPREITSDLQPHASALYSVGLFLRRQWHVCLALSAAVLVPCFWQRRIQAGDLASHSYNAWLTHLIERGEAPGLWIARQWDNVLFDFALYALGDRFGLPVAERLVVSVAVLIFFWGAFALASAAARRAAWLAVPCLAMVAYGWTFQMGFFNYYISLGIAFFGLALLWRGRGWERAAVLPLAPLIWLAHPLGVLLLAGAGAWIIAAERFGLPGQLIAGFAAVAALFAVRSTILRHYQVFQSREPRYFFSGLDQMLLYGPHYRLPAALLLASCLCCIISNVLGFRRGERPSIAYGKPAALYGLALLTILLLPETILLPQFAAPAGFLHERLSCICAVFACCALATMKQRKLHLAGFAAAAAVFFLYLYADTIKINRMEDRAESIAASLPLGARVLATIPPPDGSRILIFHIVDRACIGRCFSYGNYEPGSGQFRVRASPGNRIVTTSMRDSFAMQRGTYTVQPQDLPLFQVQPCSVNAGDLCASGLVAGDISGQPSAIASGGASSIR